MTITLTTDRGMTVATGDSPTADAHGLTTLHLLADSHEQRGVTSRFILAGLSLDDARVVLQRGCTGRCSLCHRHDPAIEIGLTASPRLKGWTAVGSSGSCGLARVARYARESGAERHLLAGTLLLVHMPLADVRAHLMRQPEVDVRVDLDALDDTVFGRIGAAVRGIQTTRRVAAYRATHAHAWEDD